MFSNSHFFHTEQELMFGFTSAVRTSFILSTLKVERSEKPLTMQGMTFSASITQVTPRSYRNSIRRVIDILCISSSQTAGSFSYVLQSLITDTDWFCTVRNTVHKTYISSVALLVGGFVGFLQWYLTFHIYFQCSTSVWGFYCISPMVFNFSHTTFPVSQYCFGVLVHFTYSIQLSSAITQYLLQSATSFLHQFHW